MAFSENAVTVTGCGAVAVNGTGVATCTAPAITKTTVDKPPDVFSAKFAGTTKFAGSTSSSLDVSAVPALKITTTSADLPTPTSGNNVAISLDADGGVGPFTWSLDKGSKALPGTLQVFSTGEVAGELPKVTKKTTYKFKVDVVDESPSPQTDTQTLTLTVNPGTTTALTITTTSLPSALVTKAYSATVGATGGKTPYTWTVAGTLPPGLTINKTSGKISGTATSKGDYAFNVDVTGAKTSSTAAQLLRITVGSYTVTTVNPPEAKLNQTYQYALEATGGTGTNTWAVSSSADTFPPGLTLTPATGLISGKITSGSGGSFYVYATDGRGTITNYAQLTISVVGALVVPSTTLPPGEAGYVYSGRLAAYGGTPPYTWAVTKGAIPTGLTLLATGDLSGTVTASLATRFFTFTAKVTDAAAHTVTKTFSIYVVSALEMATTASVVGDQGVPYDSFSTPANGQGVPSGGSGTFTWFVSGGTLPPGISLKGNGLMSGTPTTVGVWVATLHVTDGYGGSLTEKLTFTISTKPTITTTALPAGVVGTHYVNQLARSGGSGPFTWSVTFTGPTIPGIGVQTSGAFFGEPTTSGFYPLTIRLSDKAGAVVTKTFTVTVSGPPSAPQDVLATASPTVPNQVDATWTAPKSDGGRAVTSYDVTAYEILKGTTTAPIVITNPGGGTPPTTATLSGLIAGQPYAVHVTATNVNGVSASATTGSYFVIPTSVVPSSSNSATSTTSTGSAHAKLGTFGQPGFIAVTGADGKGTVNASTYGSNPVPVTPGPGLFYDAKVSPGATFLETTYSYGGAPHGSGQVVNLPISIQICGVTDGEQVEWWLPDTQKFERVPSQTPATGPGNCVSMYPSATQLDGTVFWVPAPPATAVAGQWNVATPTDYEPPNPGVVTPNDTFAELDTVSCPTTAFCLTGGQTDVNAGNPLLETVVNGVRTDISTALPPTIGPVDEVSCTSATSCVALASIVTFPGAVTHTARVDWILTMAGPAATPHSWTKAALPALPLPTSYKTGTTSITYKPTKPRYFSTRDLSCTSSTFCVSTGAEYAIYTESQSGNPSFTEDAIFPVVLTLSGTTWTVTNLPEPTGLSGYAGGAATISYLASVSCVATTTCVAVGGYTTGHSGTVAHEWDETLTAGVWHVGPSPINSTVLGRGGFTLLRSVSCPAKTHCVAVGYGAWSPTGKATTGQAVVETLTNGTWTYQDMPWAGSLLKAVSCTSTTACIAGGIVSLGQTTITGRFAVQAGFMATLTGSTWTVDPVTQGTNWSSTIQQVSSPSTRAGVAVGHTNYDSMVLYRLAIPPTVTSVRAPTGPLAGGTSVTIAGTGFFQSTTFDFGAGRAATDVVCRSSSLCTAKVPAGTGVGTVPVTATTGPLTSSATGAPTYRYLPAAPTVTKVTADVGIVAGGTVVTISGSGFSTTGGATAFTFGSHRPATAVSCSSSTTCVATTPQGGLGFVDVVAAVGGQNSATNAG